MEPLREKVRVVPLARAMGNPVRSVPVVPDLLGILPEMKGVQRAQRNSAPLPQISKTARVSSRDGSDGRCVVLLRHQTARSYDPQPAMVILA